MQQRLETTLSAAHKIDGHDGPCKYLHGHDWRVQAVADEARADVVSDALGRVVSRFHMKYLNELPQFRAANPTAETISRVLYEEVRAELRGDAAALKRVTVWETPQYSCGYFEE